ncbi:hypothetical protein ACWGSP_30490, partial [Streptomyces diastaticus]
MATSVAVIAANASALWLGRRSVSVQVEDGVTAEERRLLERLDPSYWVQHADSRGLSGTLTERPEVTAAGIVCGVRLDGKGWSAKKLAAESAAVPALRSRSRSGSRASTSRYGRSPACSARI